MTLDDKMLWLEDNFTPNSMGCAGCNKESGYYYVFCITTKVKIAGIRGTTLDLAYGNLYDAMKDSLYELCI